MADNHKAAFLGRSDGILGSLNLSKGAEDMEAVIKDRMKRKMRKAKVLI